MWTNKNERQVVAIYQTVGKISGRKIWENRRKLHMINKNKLLCAFDYRSTCLLTTYTFNAYLIFFLDSPGLCLLHHPSLLCMRQPAGLFRERTSLFLSCSLLLLAHWNGASAAWVQSAQCHPPGSGPSLPTQESQEAGPQAGFTAGVTLTTGLLKWTREWDKHQHRFPRTNLLKRAGVGCFFLFFFLI